MIYDLRIIINAFNFIDGENIWGAGYFKQNWQRERERDRRFDKSINILPSIRQMKIYKSIDISVNFDEIAKKEEEEGRSMESKNKRWKNIMVSSEKLILARNRSR